MTTLRLGVGLIVLAAALTLVDAGDAGADPCEPRLAHRVAYTESRYQVTYAIQLCTDEPSVFYGSEVQRQVSDSGFVVNTDGLAPCRHRVCHTTVWVNHPAPEIAGYRSNIFWFIGPVAPTDEVRWRVCATVGDRWGCRSTGPSTPERASPGRR